MSPTTSMLKENLIISSVRVTLFPRFESVFFLVRFRLCTCHRLKFPLHVRTCCFSDLAILRKFIMLVNMAFKCVWHPLRQPHPSLRNRRILSLSASNSVGGCCTYSSFSEWVFKNCLARSYAL